MLIEPIKPKANHYPVLDLVSVAHCVYLPPNRSNGSINHSALQTQLPHVANQSSHLHLHLYLHLYSSHRVE